MAVRRTGMFFQRHGVLLDDSGDLIAGVSAVLRRLRQAGVVLVAVHDGTVGANDVEAAAAERLTLLLADEDVGLDANLFSTEPIGHSRRPPRPGMLLEAAASLGVDLLSSWVVASDSALIRAAGQAGCCGAVLVGDAADPDARVGIPVARACDLADAPRVMVPPGGGCWHERR